MPEADDAQQDAEHEVVVKALEGSEQGAADAACAHEADDGRVAQVAVAQIGHEADETEHHLRHDGEAEHVQERSAGGAHRLDLLHRDFFYGLGKELAHEADARHRQCQDARERAKADRLHEHDGDDDGVKTAAHGDDEACTPAHPARHQVARRQQAQRQAEQQTERGGEHGDLQAFDQALDELGLRLEKRRPHAVDELRAVVHAGEPARPGQIDARGCPQRQHQQQRPADALRKRHRERAHRRRRHRSVAGQCGLHRGAFRR
jgi:hypothetical protein